MLLPTCSLTLFYSVLILLQAFQLQCSDSAVTRLKKSTICNFSPRIKAYYEKSLYILSNLVWICVRATKCAINDSRVGSCARKNTPHRGTISFWLYIVPTDLVRQQTLATFKLLMETCQHVCLHFYKICEISFLFVIIITGIIRKFILLIFQAVTQLFPL